MTNKEKIISRLNSFDTLKPGWGCYEHSEAIHQDIKLSVIDVINNLDDEYLKAWTVFPCVDGAILFDCLDKNVDSCIHFSKNNKASAFVKVNNDILLTTDNVSYSDESIYKIFETVYKHTNKV